MEAVSSLFFMYPLLLVPLSNGGLTDMEGEAFLLFSSHHPDMRTLWLPSQIRSLKKVKRRNAHSGIDTRAWKWEDGGSLELVCLLGRMSFSTNKKVGFLLSKKNFNHLTPPFIFSVGISGSECALRGKKRKICESRVSVCFPLSFSSEKMRRPRKGKWKKFYKEKRGSCSCCCTFDLFLRAHASQWGEKRKSFNKIKGLRTLQPSPSFLPCSKTLFKREKLSHQSFFCGKEEGGSCNSWSGKKG